MRDLPALLNPGSRRFKLLLVLAALGAGIGYLAVIAARSGTAYYVTPSELLAGASTRSLYRLGGRVMPGSIQWDEGHRSVRFVVADGDEAEPYALVTGGRTVPASYAGLVPNLFAERAFVVLEGRYTADGVFAATSLVIKHESEFIAERERSLED